MRTILKLNQLINQFNKRCDLFKRNSKLKFDVNNFPRFTWNSILPDQQNFPFDHSYDRWSDIKKKYNLDIRDYQKQGDKILFFYR